jgi:hypothetical protein
MTRWRRRHRERIRRLENAVAEARTERAELARRMELFEKIAAAAGLELDESPAPAAVPEALLAAARDQRSGGAPVYLDLEGRRLVAVVGGDSGDPREWWAAIQRLASRQQDAS